MQAAARISLSAAARISLPPVRQQSIAGSELESSANPLLILDREGEMLVFDDSFSALDLTTAARLRAALQEAAYKATPADHSYVPWVVVNGKLSADRCTMTRELIDN